MLYDSSLNDDRRYDRWRIAELVPVALPVGGRRHDEKDVCMPRENASPVSFRLSAEDRRLVEAVAAYRDQSLSDFVRSVVMEAAATVVRTTGRDEILRSLRESNRRLNREKLDLYERGVDHATPSR